MKTTFDDKVCLNSASCSYKLTLLNHFNYFDIVKLVLVTYATCNEMTFFVLKLIDFAKRCV